MDTRRKPKSYVGRPLGVVVLDRRLVGTVTPEGQPKGRPYCFPLHTSEAMMGAVPLSWFVRFGGERPGGKLYYYI